jgi:hypothetical protein
MFDDADLNAIASEGVAKSGDCGCRGAREMFLPVEGVALDDLDLLWDDLDRIETREAEDGDELSLALAGEDLSLEEELDFAAALEEPSSETVGLDQLLELIRAHPGLKITIGF